MKEELFDSPDEFRTWFADTDIIDAEADFNVVLLLMVKKLGLYPHNFANWARERDIDVHFWSHP